MAQVTTSLVLGSGGARGLTHIGVIACLLERGYDIRFVAGSSIGALVGGIYAAGKLDVYADWVSALQRSDVLRLLDWSLGKGALFKGQRVIAVLKELIGERDIEDLPVGYTAVATDLSQAGRGREIWIDRGPLFDAIRASIAIPTVFAPVKSGRRLLLDGSITNPVPIGPTLNNHTDLTIAVDLNGPYELEPIPAPPPQPPKPPGLLQSVYREHISVFLDKRRASPKPPPESSVGFLELVLRSMETMQESITQFKLAANTPDVVIRIPRNLCGFFEFHRARELIDFGFARAEQALKEYEKNYPLPRPALESGASAVADPRERTADRPSGAVRDAVDNAPDASPGDARTVAESEGQQSNRAAS